MKFVINRCFPRACVLAERKSARTEGVRRGENGCSEFSEQRRRRCFGNWRLLFWRRRWWYFFEFKRRKCPRFRLERFPRSRPWTCRSRSIRLVTSRRQISVFTGRFYTSFFLLWNIFQYVLLSSAIPPNFIALGTIGNKLRFFEILHEICGVMVVQKYNTF